MATSAAALAFLALAAGCSNDVARFDDGFYTGAVPRQSVPGADVGQNQAYPGDIDRVNTGSVGRNSFGMPDYGSNPGAGVRQQASQGDGQQPYPDANGGSYGGRQRYASLEGDRPVRSAGIERSTLAPPTVPRDSAMTEAPRASGKPDMSAAPRALPASSSLRPAAAAPSRSPATTAAKAGWSNNGTSVALRQGETIDTLSNRFGVPAKAILSANGMKDASEARPGQQIAIPSYSYGASPSAGRTSEVRSSEADRTPGAPPAPLHAPAADAGGSKANTIVVGAGDSLMGIARKTGVPVADLRSANNITDDNIRIGQKLVLPKGAAQPKQMAALEAKPAKPAPKVVAEPKPAAEAVIAQPKPYEAPHAAAAKPADPAPAPVAAKVETPATSVEAETESEVATAAPAGTGIDQFRWPVQGRVVSRFGDKSGARRSDGLDISVPRGTPVKAAENGVVIYAGDGLKEFGNTILVKHDNGLVTVYGHADDLKVKRGATVRRGQEIATAGMSGDTDTPMVHFEVRKNSAPVDPMKFLK